MILFDTEFINVYFIQSEHIKYSSEFMFIYT